MVRCVFVGLVCCCWKRVRYAVVSKLERRRRSSCCCFLLGGGAVFDLCLLDEGAAFNFNCWKRCGVRFVFFGLVFCCWKRVRCAVVSKLEGERRSGCNFFFGRGSSVQFKLVEEDVVFVFCCVFFVLFDVVGRGYGVRLFLNLLRGRVEKMGGL